MSLSNLSTTLMLALDLASQVIANRYLTTLGRITQPITIINYIAIYTRQSEIKIYYFNF
jgi:hypothetical protein